MTLSNYITDYLKRHRKVDIINFGTFTLLKTKAVFDADTQTLLPPSTVVEFERNDDVKDGGLINFVAHSCDVSLQHVKRDLDVQVDYWKKKISARENFSIEGLGNFCFTEEQMHFDGVRLEDESPDFYGLEKINLQDIQLQEEQKEVAIPVEEEVRGGRWVLWTFLLAIPLVGLGYAAYRYQDLLLGKASTADMSIKTSTHRISTTTVDSVQVEKDTLPLKQDSAKVDSFQVSKPQTKPIQ